MPRSVQKKRKRSLPQKENLKKVNQRKKKGSALADITNNTPIPLTQEEEIKKLEEELAAAKQEIADEKERSRRKEEESKKKIGEANKKYWNERRKSARWRERAERRKVDLHVARAEAARLRGVVQRLDKELCENERNAAAVVEKLQAEVKQLRDHAQDLNQRRVYLWKRTRRMELAKSRLVKQLKEAREAARPSSFKMMKRGMYTLQVRKLARVMVKAGAAEAKVGEALQQVAEAMGVEMPKKLSTRSIGRFVLELDIAADIQLVYEIIKSNNITYSSDSTSHKHVEYECRTVAMQVVDWTNPDAPPEWKQRTFGIGTSINHTSEVQVEGLRERLKELGDLFNRSPFAKREGLRFVPDDFVYKLLGTTGDHAADQKKSHELLRIWRLEVILQRMGEEALLDMDPSRVLAVLIGLKAKQVEECGGQAAWDALPKEKKEELDILLVREIGKQVFDKLPEADQQELTRFIRTGCCMHKDLNCFKAGVKALAEMWKGLDVEPPVLLANKDNAAVLEAADDLPKGAHWRLRRKAAAMQRSLLD